MLANGGRFAEPYVVRQVRSLKGDVLFARKPPPAAQVVAPAQVAAMNDMLNGALVSGTGKRAAIPLHAAAGKTGTTQSFRDAWFIGYTAHLTTGVWAGNDDGSAMNRVVGGSLPAEIWREIMTRRACRHGSRCRCPAPSRRRPLRSAEPVYPQERIADDFIARALGAGAADTGSIEQLMSRISVLVGVLGTARSGAGRGRTPAASACPLSSSACSRSTCAQKRGPWFISARWATSCAAT